MHRGDMVANDLHVGPPCNAGQRKMPQALVKLAQYSAALHQRDAHVLRNGRVQPLDVSLNEIRQFGRKLNP